MYVVLVNMGFYEELIEGLKKALDERFGGKYVRLAKAAGSHPTTIKRIVEGERSKRLDLVSRLADQAGLSIQNFSEGSTDTTREVKFVAPKILSAEEMAEGPIPEDYFAVPLAEGEVAAGMGRVPEDRIRSWVLIWRHHESVRFRSNLVAVEIGKGEDSMIPTLHPEDLVAVDRDDFKNKFDPPGNIFLVRYPDGDIAIKRVNVVNRGKDFELTFYSDNAMKHPPSPAYSLREHFQGEINRAVMGRVVWGWSNMTKK
mgnify:CR=1 FL=1